MDLENLPKSKSGKRMLSYVNEDWYKNSYVGKWLYEVMGIEMDELWAIVESLQDQIYPETATWGLMYHEMKYSLPVDETMSIEDRRNAIVQKRDIRKPMNPFIMETIISNLVGRDCTVKDSNDDASIPANTFVVSISDPANADSLSITKAIAKLNQLKQSHVTYKIKVCASADLKIYTRKTPWKTVSVVAGTRPQLSRGLSFMRSDIDLETASTSYHNVYPAASDNVKTGTYPTESTGLRQNADSISVETDAESYHNLYPETGDRVKAGSYPIESTSLHENAESVLSEITTATFSTKSKICGLDGL